MLAITILFPTWKMIVKAFCSIFYLLYKSFHQVLQSSIIYLVLQPEPFTSIIVTSGTICVNGFSTISISQLSRIANKQKLSFLTEYIYVFICICISMYITIFDRCIITHNLRLGSYVIHIQ
jgi:hypothetical protein